MKSKIIELYKDNQYYKLNHRFTFTFTLGVVSLILLSLILFLVYHILSFALSLFPNISIGELILIVTYCIVGILLIGKCTSLILDKWSGP